MRQNKFESYDDYVDAQRVTTCRKMQRAYKRCFAVDSVVDNIVEYHCDVADKPVYGLCHGVRYGEELDKFEKKFGGGVWIGTEIVSELCDDVRIFNYDFSWVKDGWIGNFDLIYSNSFDHARYPRKVAKAWISCLSPSGRLYVEWSPWHNKLGGRSAKADCFAASADEYMKIFQKAGVVEHRLEFKLKNYSKYTFVIRRG